MLPRAPGTEQVCLPFWSHRVTVDSPGVSERTGLSLGLESGGGASAPARAGVTVDLGFFVSAGGTRVGSEKTSLKHTHSFSGKLHTHTHSYAHVHTQETRSHTHTLTCKHNTHTPMHVRTHTHTPHHITHPRGLPGSQVRNSQKRPCSSSCGHVLLADHGDHEVGRHQHLRRRSGVQRWKVAGVVTLMRVLRMQCALDGHGKRSSLCVMLSGFCKHEAGHLPDLWVPRMQGPSGQSAPPGGPSSLRQKARRPSRVGRAQAFLFLSIFLLPGSLRWPPAEVPAPPVC